MALVFQRVFDSKHLNKSACVGADFYDICMIYEYHMHTKKEVSKAYEYNQQYTIYQVIWPLAFQRVFDSKHLNKSACVGANFQGICKIFKYHVHIKKEGYKAYEYNQQYIIYQVILPLVFQRIFDSKHLNKSACDDL